MARTPAKDVVERLIAGAPIDERSCLPKRYGHFEIARAIYGSDDPTARQRLAVRLAVAALVASGDVIGESDPDWPSPDPDGRRRRSRLRRIVALEPPPVAFTRRMTTDEERARDRFIRKTTRQARERFVPGPATRAPAAGHAPA